MLVASSWGLVGGLAVLLGALLGIFTPVSNRVVGLVMAFGAGVLINAAPFELTPEAFVSGGAVLVATGLVAGAPTFFAGDWAIDRVGGHRRKSPTGEHQAGAGAPPVTARPRRRFAGTPPGEARLDPSDPAPTPR